MIDKQAIDQLYALYEFEKDKENKYCCVYTYDQGYFNNAEIVVFDPSKKTDLDSIQEEYTRIGYSVSLREAKDYEEIKSKLFHGFFKIEASNQKVLIEYEEHTKIQSKRLSGNPYSYIESQYILNDEPRSDHIVDKVFEIISRESAQLVILEAPAGFGKTCTSYEISKIISSKRQHDIVPILAELSKNRSARIFSYVLLTEIDRKFPRLSSALVTEQIKEGNIPLIIDGFDELLSKSSTEDDDTLEESKTMLDTIANFFTENSRTKIVLTSRKSSILTGDVFAKWIAEKLRHCDVNRIQILNPTVAEWIGNDKKKYFESKRIMLDHIANPVLLAMLRSIPLEDFDQRFQCSSDILENYFNILLEREKERQQLYLSVDEQKMIMRKLAAMFVQFDMSADEPDNIQVLIEEIIEPDIVKYLSYYNDAAANNEISIPTEDEFTMKLVHNALLDRVNLNSNNIGFINDFIFGVLIGDAVLEGDLKIEDVTEKYLSLMLTAYVIESADKRKRLYNVISTSSITITTEQKLVLDMNLTERLGHDFVDEYISNILFRSTFDMKTEHFFYNCIFESCTFERNKLENVLFEGCHFINCTFYNIEIIESGTIEEESVFISCTGHEKLYESLFNTMRKNSIKGDGKDARYYEKLVLEQFWMKGSNAAEPRKTYRTLCKGIKQQEKAKVLAAVDDLLNRRILVRLTYCLELNFSKMTEIKDILGR
ncbi:MAG: hypothetical protein NC331_03525 [Lachnospiraceae bacterium]|nr:hypothetical protein [Lachnospiraceae bacterium]MCM1215695.1 hypothetical protein [Lachnospiraceae bacterium]MCM1238438.1 hypothetical protein [Lachnospiraceae bacterium]